MDRSQSGGTGPSAYGTGPTVIIKNLRELSQPQERFAPKFKRNQEKEKKFEVVFIFV